MKLNRIDSKRALLFFSLSLRCFFLEHALLLDLDSSMNSGAGKPRPQTSFCSRRAASSKM